MLRKYWAESFRNFGIGLMVASVVLLISEKVLPLTSLLVFGFGFASVVFGSILLMRGGKDDQ